MLVTLQMAGTLLGTINEMQEGDHESHDEIGAVTALPPSGADVNKDSTAAASAVRARSPALGGSDGHGGSTRGSHGLGAVSVNRLSEITRQASAKLAANLELQLAMKKPLGGIIC